MRSKLYNFLVNRKAGIQYRYHRAHDNSAGLQRIISYLYLLWLNFAYYVLQLKFLGRRPQVAAYEEKRLNIKRSESEEYLRRNPDLTVEAYVDRLLDYDIISFDVFDTLIFRPFAQPTDLFYLTGEQMDISNFVGIRTWAEWDARVKCNNRNGHMEINLRDIWDNLAEDAGCSSDMGMQTEIHDELELCYANPFMLEVWRRLRKTGKRIIVVSDMYLFKDAIVRMIENAGFTGAERVYVSNEYGKNKASGTLFELVKKDYAGKKLIHVGDNPHSDKAMAERCGFNTFPYQNAGDAGKEFRADDMSPIVGSAYRGIVNNTIYNGLCSYSMEYEYGFIYGGLFVVGYCNFIHSYCLKNNIDIILFLSRDGHILKQIYDSLFPEDKTIYCYWSRKAATVLMADQNRDDYYRRFVHHKVNQCYTIGDILKSADLEGLINELDNWSAESGKGYTLHSTDILTDKTINAVRAFIQDKWSVINGKYGSKQVAAQLYYKRILRGAGSAAAVDIGWAGSGALALSHLCEYVWDIPCHITGIIAGTNTIYNAEPDASEPFLQSGKLISYMYSQSHNRDLLKKHDPNKDYNVFWELLLGSPTPQFAGFDIAIEGAEKTLDGFASVKGNVDTDKHDTPEHLALLKEQEKYLDGIKLSFGDYDDNLDGIREVQRGIKDFAAQYMEHFTNYPYMLNISGRDAYAPMLVAASYKERYLKAIEEKFDLKINVD